MKRVLYIFLFSTIFFHYSQAQRLEEATFGAGCFWCVEAIFQRLKGVESVEAGYSGGGVKNPSYRAVSTGNTGHAEVTRIVFNAEMISFETLTEIFFYTHNPSTLNRQGYDRGTQYRSVIFYHNATQKRIGEAMLAKIDKTGYYDAPIVTEISPLVNYYPAEDYHQNYYENNPDQTYCKAVIQPKLKKFLVQYSDMLKE